MDGKNERTQTEQRLQHRVEELEKRAFKDALSGLLNRETAELCVKKRLGEMRAGENCALFIVDLDNFKNVNDTLGHQSGDRAIRQAASIISGLFRASDIVGRLGGDEFLIFLSGHLTASLIRQKGAAICKALQMVLGSSPSVNLTASVGIQMASAGQRFEDLYQAADLALYKAKRAGKHSVCLMGGDFLPEGEGESLRQVNTIPLGSLLENLDSGVALLEMGDPLRLLYVSPSFCRLLGVSAQSFRTPKLLTDLIHPDDLAELEQALEAALREKRPAVHTHRISADGKNWIWWRIRAVEIPYDASAPVMLVTTTDITAVKERELSLQEDNQRLQMAFAQTAQHLWEVDLTSGAFRIFDRDGISSYPETDQAVFPESLFANSWVHPSSLDRFREFADELMRGRAQGCGNFIVQDLDTGCYGWAALSYRMLYDEAGRPVKAVGTREDLPQNFAGRDEDAFSQPLLPENLAEDLLAALRGDLLRDTVEELWTSGRDITNRVGQKRCSEILSREMERIYGRERQDPPVDLADREGLLRTLREGCRWLSMECRRVDRSGSIHWVRYVLHLTGDGQTAAFLTAYLIRLDPYRQWESAADGEIVRDPVSGICSRETVKRVAEAILRRGGPETCAAALLRTGGVLRRYEGDRQALDQVRRAVACALSVALGSSCILGQYADDEILMFFPATPVRRELRRRLEEAAAFARRALAADRSAEGLRFVTGVACQIAAEASYETLAARAAHACAMWWNTPSDTVAFAQEDDDWSWTELQSDGGDDRVAVHSQEMERPLSEGEKDVAFQCVSAMLAADSLQTSVQSVLRDIGTYYRADRVYILTLGEDRRVLTMPFEWADPGKPAIRNTVSGMRLESFPMLRRCLEERAPVFLTRPSPTAPRGSLSSGAPWHFTTFPLIEKEKVEGFLCIENAREHPSDAALFSTLIPYLLRERQRFQNAGEEDSAARVAEIPNLRSYTETISSLTSDRYSSMGAVCLDIPGMAAINSSLGFEYGGKLLWYVSRTLMDLFGPSLLFRTWDAEFVALSPNTTKKVFVERCGRLRSILQRRYPRELRIGYTWANGIFSGKNLVEEARAVMRSEAAEDADSMGSVQARGYRDLKEATLAGRFSGYFQPKVDMRTGALFGAEALVRGVGDDGTVISPDQFIKELEKSGSIREMDLYVLNQALSQMDRWREEGLGVVPTSVNLSRVTLLHPNTMASILAVQSRYPKLPPEALELEITESAGSIETSELQEIVERFRSCGLRISLDDFGSQYANIPLFTSVKFDTVKLDRSLIRELVDNPINRMLIRDIICICHACGMTCVAEGVESTDQISALTEMGCSYAQGFYYDRPLPAERFEQKYLRGGKPAETT